MNMEMEARNCGSNWRPSWSSTVPVIDAEAKVTNRQLVG